MPMTRILQVLGSLQRGGAETMVMNIYRNIDHNEFQFDFLVKDRVDIGYEEEVIKLGGHIYQVESAKKIGVFRYVLGQSKVMKQFGPYDVVHSHVNVQSGLTVLAAWLAGVKTRISHSHNTQFNNPAVMEFICKTLIHIFANKRIACGKDAGHALFGNRKFSVIPNGIETDKFLLHDLGEFESIRKKLNMNSECIQICHVGRFNDVKNHSFILDIARELESIGIKYELHLLGNGELFDATVEKAKKTNLQHVFFHGSVNNANEYIKASDVFILPSKHEGLPVTLVEAQCAGIPCYIADNITKEVDFGVGLVSYLPLNLESWVDALRKFNVVDRFSKNEAVHKALAERGYSIESSVKKVESIYKNESYLEK